MTPPRHLAAPLPRTPRTLSGSLPQLLLERRWPLALGLLLCLTVLAEALLSGIALTPDLPGVFALSPLLRFDVLSLPVFAMTLVIGVSILFYASTYLQGDPGRARFGIWFLATLVSVSVLVLSNNLLLLIGARFASSLCLLQLLTFYPERPRARLAAHKKFLVSRVADIFLLSAAGLIWARYDTLRLDELFAAHAAEGGALGPGLQLATVLLACAALLQCAQLPVHGWLMQVMEAPTPVSALLHAGIVNVGGFLMIRFAPLLVEADLARGLLVVVGGITAAVASLVMLTRISVKVMLAWSTCAQMGFMLVECGLGLWSLALLHLMAHSFYKAYAFLSSGQAVEQNTARVSAPSDVVPRARAWALAALLVVASVGALAVLSGESPTFSPQGAVLAMVLGSAAIILVAEGLATRSKRVLGWLCVAALVLVALHLGWHRVFGALLEPLVTEDGGSWWTAGFVLVLFAALLALHAAVRSAPDSPLVRRLYPLFYGGLFLDELSTRIVLRVWPTRLLRLASPDSRDSVGLTAGSHVGGGAVGERGSGSPASQPRPSTGYANTASARASFRVAVETVCDAQAPAWPLSSSIAVNPFWELRGESFERVSARLAERSGARLLPRSEHLRPLVTQGVLTQSHLDEAGVELGLAAPSLAEVGRLDAVSSPSLPLWTHWLDAQRDLDHVMSWEEEVTHQISQFCAAWFDRGQARWSPGRRESLYAAWHRAVRQDRGLSLLMGSSNVASALAQLPRTTDELLDEACAALALPENELERVLHGLLLRLNGWASCCAYLRWQARLQGHDDDSLRELLAIRLGWELALMRGEAEGDDADRWRAALGDGAEREARIRTAQASARVWQRAAELAFQEPLARSLAVHAGEPDSHTRPGIQAAFCIDVRSEVYRRAFEACGEHVATLGFAGFFGLPIAVEELGSESVRPQLPGLLAPGLLVRERCASEATTEDEADLRSTEAARHERWRLARAAAAASFSIIESFGLLHAWKLLRASLGGVTSHSHSAVATRPYLAVDLSTGEAVTLARRTELAAGILRGLSLGDRPAPLILLVGHGSSSTNNPGAAALDCGACCGQPGVINARVAASLLNEPEVRAGLAALGRELPEDTWFVAGLHDTTTDVVTLQDLDLVPPSHLEQVTEARAALDAASVRARAERAPGLGLASTDQDRLEQSLLRRAGDWSQVRPEWGLANNAAFIVAPRERTRGVDLHGRAFLHEYRWRDDDDFAVLEGILTAPMLVTQWINMQYYASTVDQPRYGSGNKVLHNVVGGNLGVFEGNGGDLRIGLARQSLHDGEQWRHTPLRLSVYVQAPRDAIAEIVARNPTVAELVDNEWLYLFQLEEGSPGVSRLHRGTWSDTKAAKPPLEAAAV